MEFWGLGAVWCRGLCGELVRNECTPYGVLAADDSGRDRRDCRGGWGSTVSVVRAGTWIDALGSMSAMARRDVEAKKDRLVTWQALFHPAKECSQRQLNLNDFDPPRLGSIVGNLAYF